MMRQYFGGGWWIRHYTDREFVITKEDYLYRQVTGEDGYVKVAVQPGLSREELYKEAERIALQCDAKVMEFVARDVLPDMASYRMKATPVNKLFETPESERIIGRKSL
jgi:hypothetical protein